MFQQLKLLKINIMDRDFKFKLGDIVSHVTDTGRYSRLLIIERGIMEGMDDVSIKYTTSSVSGDQILRQMALEQELILFTPIV